MNPQANDPHGNDAHHNGAQANGTEANASRQGDADKNGTTLIPSATPAQTLGTSQPTPRMGGQPGAGTVDPRDRVTPEAFFVAPEMLGKPLAKPQARAWAWVIDGAIVGMLSQAGSFLLAVALAVLSYQMINKRKRQGNEGNGQLASVGKLPGIMMAFFIGWAALMAFDWLFDDEPPRKKQKEVAEQVVEAAMAAPTLSPLELEVKALRAENAALKEEQEVFSVLETGQRLLDDIGFGFGWGAVYFSLLTAWLGGQTIGKRMFGLRVLKLNGKPITVWESFNRYGGYAAGFATGLLGFAQVYWDANRQAIHDQIAFTVVVDDRRQ